jgi:predicted TIM-barrel fold metal-dependent hydrolase
VEDLIAFMDLNGIDRTVLIQCMYHGYDNSYMCDGLRRYPDRLHGVALIDPRKPGAAAELERLHREHGVQGMRLYPIRDRDASWLSAEDQSPLWETARRLGVPFTWFGRCDQIPLLELMLQRFPDVRVIVDHLGEPVLSEGLDGSFRMLLEAAEHANLYVKATRIDGISGQPWPHEDVHPFVRAIRESFGASRMLGCTGFPEDPQRGEAVGFRVIEEAMGFLSAEDREWILGRTAHTLYHR